MPKSCNKVLKFNHEQKSPKYHLLSMWKQNPYLKKKEHAITIHKDFTKQK